MMASTVDTEKIRGGCVKTCRSCRNQEPGPVGRENCTEKSDIGFVGIVVKSGNSDNSDNSDIYCDTRISGVEHSEIGEKYDHDNNDTVLEFYAYARGDLFGFIK